MAGKVEKPSQIGTVFPVCLWFKGDDALCGARFGVFGVETRNGFRVSKMGFRTLRSPTQGAALRTRKPFEKGLSESFISPAGGNQRSSRK